VSVQYLALHLGRQQQVVRMLAVDVDQTLAGSRSWASVAG